MQVETAVCLKAALANNILYLTVKVLLLLVLLTLVIVVVNHQFDGDLGLGNQQIDETKHPEGSGVKVSWFSVPKGSKIDLLANFGAKATSKTIIAEFGCSHLVNAGFYDEDASPIGLFKTQLDYISRSSQNKLFNGFVYQDLSGKIAISDKVDADEVVYGFQTGPLLALAGKVIETNLASDKNARRLIYVKTSDDRDIFLAVYNQESVFFGPKLAEIGDLLTDFAQTNDLDLEAAINLDGGTASVFYSPEIYLKELSVVGSFLCVTKETEPEEEPQYLQP